MSGTFAYYFACLANWTSTLLFGSYFTYHLVEIVWEYPASANNDPLILGSSCHRFAYLIRQMCMSFADSALFRCLKEHFQTLLRGLFLFCAFFMSQEYMWFLCHQIYLFHCCYNFWVNKNARHSHCFCPACSFMSANLGNFYFCIITY